MAKTQTADYPWVFTENNEWEGEVWKVYFEVTTELDYKIQKVKDSLVMRGLEDQFSLRQIEEIPEKFDNSESEDCEYGDDCGDCSYYCEDSDGYYPAEQYGTVNEESLQSVLDFFESQAWKQDVDNPLYKLGLFDLG